MARDRRPITLRPSQRRLRSRWQMEKTKQRSILVAGIIAVLFIVAIPAYGYWSNFIAPPRSVVLQVDGTKYTLGYMERYLRGLQTTGADLDMSTEPFRILMLLEESELIRKGSLAKGITLEPGELDQEIRDRILGSATGDTPVDQLDREFNERYRQYLSTVRMSQKEYRSLVEADLLRGKLTGLLGEQVPSIAKQAKLSWMVISSGMDNLEEQIGQISDRIHKGEEFAALAEEYSIDRTTAVKGGEMGWVPKGSYPSLDDAIFALQPGETSEAVFSDQYVFFLKVAEVDDARAVEPDQKSNMKEVALQEWLYRERGNHNIKVCFGGGGGGSCAWQYDWLVKKLRETS